MAMNGSFALFLLWTVTALSLPIREIENSPEPNHEYLVYQKCAEKREEEIKLFDRIVAKAEVVMQGSNLKLDCFTCLSESNKEDVEDTPKPNNAFLGRRFSEIVNDTKESNQWAFDWQFFGFADEYRKADHVGEKKPKWEVLESSMPSSKRVTRFRKLKKKDGESERSIGPLFELEKFNVARNATGLYRCVNYQNERNPIENLYFIDVSNRIRMESRFFKKESKSVNFVRTLPTKIYKEQRLDTVWIRTRMSECNGCNTNGEIREQFTCYLRISNGTSFEEFEKISESPQILLFGQVPCASSLVPRDIRSDMRDLTTVYEVAYPCEPVKCDNNTESTRIVQGLDENGDVVEADVLPPNEFTLHERLPPLLPDVRRKSQGVTIGEPLVIDCGSNTAPTLWKKDGSVLSSKLIHQSGKSERIIIRAGGELFIKFTDEEDKGLYACYTREGILMRTFNVEIMTGSMSEAAVAYLKLIMRAAAGLLLLIVVISVISETRLHSEEFEHEFAKKRFLQAEERRKALGQTETLKKPKIKQKEIEGIER